MANPLQSRFAADDIAQAEYYLAHEPPSDIDPRIERLVNDLIGRIADKWTLLVLELLEEKGTLRFTEIGRQVEGISQKMLTQTLRQMERDGLLTRTVHPVVPPRVDYALTPLGNSLSAAFCGVWVWAERNLETVEAARAHFDARD
ncbi:transcriptional regulator, HxlR family [Sphingobium sp. AP50]|uniref:winged helix-turn-helix transcriptional regulator n=1 Tax=Sphingobium sp. AP50 TaxID=1884369 RepID=UPI0008AD212F|nr:helix-turn-helix domain-containing protein [Sphingobium sp. AP50]SEI71660.1 transcriptional regulator, HxlR family [Sphingobium sp. AP50]